jgi:hypothetical protein
MIFSINELRLLAMMPDDFAEMRVAGSAAVATKYLVVRTPAS